MEIEKLSSVTPLEGESRADEYLLQLLTGNVTSDFLEKALRRKKEIEEYYEEESRKRRQSQQNPQTQSEYSSTRNNYYQTSQIGGRNYRGQVEKGAQALNASIGKYLGIPYVWGGSLKSRSNPGLDCSGFTRTVMQDLGYKHITGNAVTQWKQTRHISKEEIRPGDLVFLQGTHRKGPSHVGIALTPVDEMGNIKVAETYGKGHKSETNRTWNLKHGYYAQHWLGAGRVSNLPIARKGIKLNQQGGTLIDTTPIEANPVSNLTKHLINIIKTKNTDQFLYENNIPTYTPSSSSEQVVTQQQTGVPQQQSSMDVSGAPGSNITDAMFKQICIMEGGKDKPAQVLSKDFGETFATGPYGQVYKRIDANGNPLAKPIPFKAGEVVSDEWALANAKYTYQKRAKRWLQLLEGKPGLTQDKLDALVSGCGGTAQAKKTFENFVLSHWGDWDAICNFWRNHAITAAGNHKVQPGLVLRRQFEADWFMGKKGNFRDYQRAYYNSRKRSGVKHAKSGGVLTDKMKEIKWLQYLKNKKV